MTSSQKKMDLFLKRARQAELLMKAIESSQELDRKLLRLLKKSSNYQDFQNFQDFKKQELEKLARTRQEISDHIAQVPDLELRAILERKYLACQTMAQIAEAMHFDLRTVQRKHKKALDFLKNF
ncbi:MAG: hypothetical protein K2J71_08370 [Oscillospiraceae bacterium]|nr:hypothetical protein [Oscillospiraceae bacterium]